MNCEQPGGRMWHLGHRSNIAVFQRQINLGKQMTRRYYSAADKIGQMLYTGGGGAVKKTVLSGDTSGRGSMCNLGHRGMHVGRLIVRRGHGSDASDARCVVCKRSAARERVSAEKVRFQMLPVIGSLVPTARSPRAHWTAW